MALAAAAAAQPIGIATSNPGSIYHSTGSVLAKVLNDKTDLRATIQPFTSPNIFIPAMDAGDIEFGLANVLELAFAYNGEEFYEGRPTKNLRAVAIVYPLRVATFVKVDSPIKTYADLKGTRAPDGYTSQKIILTLLDAVYATAGLKRSDVDAVQVPSVVAGADEFVAGRTDSFFFALGAAKPREANAAVSGGIRALPIENTPQNLAAIQAHMPVAYLRKEEPGPGNVGVLETTHQMAYDALVFAHDKTPDDFVYKLVKAMHENPKDLGEFPPLRLFEPNDMARSVGPVPYHDAAIKFYKETGQWRGN